MGIDHSSCISGSSLAVRHYQAFRTGYSVQSTFPWCVGFLNLLCSLERSVETARYNKGF